MAGKGQGEFDKQWGQKEGMEICRIENMNPVRVDPKDYGNFFKGDSYILLKTIQKAGRFEWNLHFWLGAESSQDEQGTAAYRTVELDDQLGGAPIQYREVQGHESALFMSYFKGGIEYKDGGVASAFNKVERDVYKTRLFHLKGKRNVRSDQCELKANSLNEGDVFILDEGLKLVQWNGAESNKYERFKGLEVINKINEERGGRAELLFLDSGKNDEAKDAEDFWKALGGSRADIKSAAEGGDDAGVKRDPPQLWRISDESGKLEFTKEGEGTLDASQLDPKDCFLVDVGAEIFVWVGKGASKDERRKGMSFGTKYVNDNNKPNWTPINRISDGGEQPAFKSCFKNWQNKPSFQREGGAAVVAVEEKAKEQVVNKDALYAKQAQQEEKMAALDGKVEVWRVNDMKKEPLDPSLYGQFWAGDSFVILYTYKVSNKVQWIIYFWQGRDSSLDEKGASAIIAKDMDDELGGDPVQVRVEQGKEPKHLLALFKGKFIVHQGGVASGFNNVKDADSFDTDGISLFHVRGNSEYNTRAVQVEELAASLNSGDCFVLLTPETMFQWQGVNSNDQEKASSASISAVMQGKRGVEVVAEGSEPAAFWEAIGGEGEYPKSGPYEAPEADPRLFRMTCNVGYFNVEEIHGYSQDDLLGDDVMMLDVFSEVFVWVGPDAMQQEKDLALQTAMDYVKTAPDGRDAATPVYRISAGFEPPQFTQHFLGWDVSKAGKAGDDPYLLALAARGVDVSKAKEGGLVAVSNEMIGFLAPGSQAFTLEQLATRKAPEGVDPAKKEQYLSDADFLATFKMDKDKWGTTAKWKRDAAKKKNGLF